MSVFRITFRILLKKTRNLKRISSLQSWCHIHRRDCQTAIVHIRKASLISVYLIWNFYVFKNTWGSGDGNTVYGTNVRTHIHQLTQSLSSTREWMTLCWLLPSLSTWNVIPYHFNQFHHWKHWWNLQTE